MCKIGALPLNSLCSGNPNPKVLHFQSNSNQNQNQGGVWHFWLELLMQSDNVND